MATSLKKFTAAELAAAVGARLRRGRPTFAKRAALEDKVQAAIDAGMVKVSKGRLIKV